ncbi:MAG: kynureninase [Bacteroidota bacterium]
MNRESSGLAQAKELDRQDPLGKYRPQFHIPTDGNGNDIIYFCGNSLGLQPTATSTEISQVLQEWSQKGVEGHFQGNPSWIEYNDKLKPSLAAIVGAQPEEVTIMNTLSVNLHLLLVSFYKPKGNRTKILLEADAFPSDKYVVASHLKWHGLDPKEHMVYVSSADEKPILQEADIERTFNQHPNQIATAMIGGINYYTGQFLPIREITDICHRHGAVAGFDLAHAIGNVPLHLHDWGVDFAAWCHYKYMNAGPGAIAGAFIHEKHHHLREPRLEGWWGNRLSTRFVMRDEFEPEQGAEAWVMSTPPTLAIAPLRASLRIFDEVSMTKVRGKSIALTGYLEAELLRQIGEYIEIITPSSADDRGCQLSIRVRDSDRNLLNKIRARGIEIDWREPDVLRVSPCPLYNSYSEVFRFVEILTDLLDKT